MRAWQKQCARAYKKPRGEDTHRSEFTIDDIDDIFHAMQVKRLHREEGGRVCIVTGVTRRSGEGRGGEGSVALFLFDPPVLTVPTVPPTTRPPLICLFLPAFFSYVCCAARAPCSSR